tara:strand:+ start:135 stop:269 length:135 start_codon:yes stop_codon:yes gene_type:complete
MDNEINVSNGSVIIFDGSPCPETLGDLIISFCEDGYEFWDFFFV